MSSCLSLKSWGAPSVAAIYILAGMTWSNFASGATVTPPARPAASEQIVVQPGESEKTHAPHAKKQHHAMKRKHKGDGAKYSNQPKNRYHSPSKNRKDAFR
jgi:hypothetical protein